MTDVLVDANVAVKWVIQQALSDRAQKLFEDTIRARGRLIGPPLLSSEVVNSIYQHRRTRDPRWQISEAEAEAALQRYLALPVVLATPAGLYERAFAFARELGLTNSYDSLYVVLAQMLGVEMWTDDQVLLQALGGSAPWVRSLRDYPMTEQKDLL
jgi:predicted nucleic acid-binding protein